MRISLEKTSFNLRILLKNSELVKRLSGSIQNCMTLPKSRVNFKVLSANRFSWLPSSPTRQVRSDLSKTKSLHIGENLEKTLVYIQGVPKKCNLYLRLITRFKRASNKSKSVFKLFKNLKLVKTLKWASNKCQTFLWYSLHWTYNHQNGITKYERLIADLQILC